MSTPLPICRIALLVTGLLIGGYVARATTPAAWPQFRGVEGRSLAAADAKPPVQFGPASNVLWKIEIPAGHSSPCIWGDRIFLTGNENGKLETLCLDRNSGKLLWTAPAPAEKAEPTHRISNPAASTPITDGTRVYVYFGSYGLLAYDLQGKPVWSHPLNTPSWPINI